MAAVMPLEAMDGGVLAALQRDQVRRAVIASLPVDVVDIFAWAQLSPQNIFSDRMCLYRVSPPIICARWRRSQHLISGPFRYLVVEFNSLPRTSNTLPTIV